MKLSNLVKSLQTDDDNQTKRVGYSCVVELDEKNKDHLPVKFRVDGPYGSPHQVRKFTFCLLVTVLSLYTTCMFNCN